MAHSRSPQIHAAFAEQCGVQLEYAKAEVAMGGFPQFVDQFVASGGRGLNITLPFKTQAYKYVNSRDAFAQAAGAVNTIKCQPDGMSQGFNTDGIGLVNDLQQRHGLDLTGKTILILGAGGATQGVLQPLLKCAPKAVWVANRTKSKAVSLVVRHADEFPLVTLSAMAFDKIPQVADVVVNATSTGLQGGALLIPAEFIRNAFCYDMSYGAAAHFQSWAAANGAKKSVDGLGMLVEQAAESFLIWQGQRPMTDPVVAFLREELREDLRQTQR